MMSFPSHMSLTKSAVSCISPGPTATRASTLRAVAPRLSMRMVRRRGRPEGQRNETTEFTEQQTTIYELQPIGRYGLTPIWGDGHHTGIYTYEKLRASCQCDECRATRA